MGALSRALALSVLIPASVAVMVATGSPCSTNCGNVLDATTDDDIVCDESNYGSSAGIVWEACLNCESTSSYSVKSGKSNYTDLQAMLYNMRYATSTCLFGTSLGDNPCITTTACEPLQSAIEYDSLASNVSEWGYCSLWSSDQVSKCDNCLSNLDNGHFLRNYLNILNGACSEQPATGKTLTLQGRIFSTDIVNVTSPSVTPSASASTGLSGPLTVGAVVGIVIGGIAFLLGVAGCCIVTIGRRKRRAYLRQREAYQNQWPAPGAMGEMYETPISQRPLRGWDESPISAATERTFPPSFSPYHSNYNSPVSVAEAPGYQPHWPSPVAHSIGLAVSPSDEYAKQYSQQQQWEQHWVDKKGKEPSRGDGDGDGYEMQEGVNSGGGTNPYVAPKASHEAPVLNHPGYGRNGRSPERSEDSESH